MLLVALCNFVWYFPKSKTVQEFGSDAISFCAACAWYLDGVHAIKPFWLLFATLFMVFNRWWGYLVTVVISGIYVIEGIIWVSRGKGFVGGISERIEIISTLSQAKIWEFLDWQYLLALIIFITASGYLIAGIAKTKQNTVNFYQ
ncbi:MAG: hypothetical protein JWN60_236 [Acidobacteria bacterium]|nr:hypothetical protein [Acidobacteriota bacterium]